MNTEQMKRAQSARRQLEVALNAGRTPEVVRLRRRLARMTEIARARGRCNDDR